MKERLSVCLVGCGMIGKVHAQTYADLGEISLYYCDNDRGRAESLAQHYGGEVISGDFRKAMRREEIDIVDICLPHDLHEEATHIACGAGKHVLLEKPIARTLEEADSILEAAKKSPGKFMVAESWRFYDNLLQAKALLEEGYIGRVFFLEGYSLHDWLHGGWRLNRKVMGGGFLIDRGVHFVAVLRYLGGDVEEVFSFPAPKLRPEMEGEDTALVQLKFASGALGNLFLSLAAPCQPPLPWFSVYGREGVLFDLNGLRLYSQRPYHPLEKPLAPVIVERQPLSERVQSEKMAKHDDLIVDCAVRHFVECVKSGREPAYSKEDARADLEIVLAAYRSAETDRPVRLNTKASAKKR